MSLDEAYRQLAEACELDLTVGAPGPADGPDWVDGGRLARDPAALRAWLDDEADRIGAACGKRLPGHVAASRALHGYLWSVGLLISGPWYLQRRVPRLRPEDVRLGPGGALHVVPAPFACLPADPAAGRPEATVLDGERELRAELRRAVADHVAPLFAALRPHLRRGERALWGMAGDDLIGGLWDLGAALGDEEHGAALATLVLPGPRAPFPGGADFRRLPDGEGLTRTRAGCCLYYVVDPDDICGTCPRRRAGAAAAPAGQPIGMPGLTSPLPPVTVLSAATVTGQAAAS
ncbi:(2Fe-2S)-binding protein [Streptomyces sp. NPDC021020]|uniref:(2Fe-2S)-binding protein n=1 Tax=Streptomyces sp. NPDC021020 TaxID=3365109 RepID=UPI003792390E